MPAGVFRLSFALASFVWWPWVASLRDSLLVVRSLTGRGSAQALLALVTMGLGSFVGSRLAGYVTERLTRDGASNWQWTFLIPCGVTLACVVVFLLLFREPPEPDGARA